MITEFDVYWITRLDYIKGLLVGVAVIAGICSVFGVAMIGFNADREYESERRYYNAGKRILAITASLVASFSILSCFVPTTKEYLLIKVVPVITKPGFVENTLSKELKPLMALVKEFTRDEKEKK